MKKQFTAVFSLLVLGSFGLFIHSEELCAAEEAAVVASEGSTQKTPAAIENTKAKLDSIFVLKKNIDSDGIEYYESNAQLKTFKRFGLGATAGGVAGIFGIQAEFNLDSTNSGLAGIGMGPGYNTFNFRYKKSLESNYLAPFATAGYSKWYNTATTSKSYEDSEVLNRILNDSEKKDGKFGADFLTASIGLEYNQLEGKMSGTTFFGEIVFMDEIKRAVLVPTGSVGVSYLF